MSRIEDELGERIRRARPPDVEALLAKQSLRRELLSRHAARMAGRRLHLRPVLLAGCAIATLALLAVIVLLPEKMSAREMLKGLEKHYREGMPPKATHYVRSEMNAASNPGPPLRIETWMAGSGMIRVMASRGGRALGHVLRIGGERYALPGKSPVDLRLEFRQGGPAASGSEKTFRNIWLFHEGNGTANRAGPARARVIVAQGGMDALAFASQVPADLYGRLEKSRRIEYLGEEAGAAGREALKSFRRRMSAALRCYTVEYDPADREALALFIRGLTAKEPQAAVGDSGRIRVSRSAGGKSFVVGETEIEERIRIGRGSGRIADVDFILSWKGETIERYRLEYLEDAFVEFKAADFDPAALGLVR